MSGGYDDEPYQAASEGRARATLEHLQKRMGFTVLGKDTAGGPTWVRVDQMESTCTWRRVSGRGATSVFEVEG